MSSFGTPFGEDTKDDDMYEGFNYAIDINPVPQNVAGVINPTSQMGARLMTGKAPSAMSRMLQTGAGAGGDGARPMTSVAGAGYTSAKKPGAGASFDPLNDQSRGPAPPLAEKADNSPEDMAKEMERQVNKLLEASAEAAAKKNYPEALAKAKEAGKKERQLCKHRESKNLVDQMNLDLTYASCFNLANSYHLNGQHDEALHTYSLIVKNKQYPQSGRLRVNMGNIHFERGEYPLAIKMYRMALDQITNTSKEIRFKIMRNIGASFVRMGRFKDAVQSFETIMEGGADFQTGFNLVICYYAIGDVERLKLGFKRLLDIPIDGMADEEDEEEEEKKQAEEAEATGEKKRDGLRAELLERQKQATHYITTAARLIAPKLEEAGATRGSAGSGLDAMLDGTDGSGGGGVASGYDWLVRELQQADLPQIASQMEIAKALALLKAKKYAQAITVLKSFEKKDPPLQAMAATNLSFLYFLEKDNSQADKYADLAIKNDRYNAKALVNKGNCLLMQGEAERAKELYLEAIGVEADCVESIYNLGLVNKRLGALAEAQQAFEKLHSILPNNPEVIYQIANLHDMTGNFQQAIKWFLMLITRVPTDPGVLSRLGQIYSKEDDETQAYHYTYEAYRHYPVNLDVISWLGVYFVKNEMYEKAIEFFERAAQIQPTEVKWRLMVTSCYRRMGSYQKALELYEQIHEEHPDNQECLRYLVGISKELGQPFDAYQEKLSKLDRAAGPAPTGNGQGMMTRAAGPVAGSGAPAVAPATRAQPRPQAVRTEEATRKIPAAASSPMTQPDHQHQPSTKSKTATQDDEIFSDDDDIGDLLGDD